MMQAADFLLAMSGAKPPPGPSDLAGEEPNASPGRLRILIVEDDTIIAWALEALLQDMQHEVVDIAATGERAIASTEEFQPDLIFMDINLGKGMDGVETARGIRRRHSAHIVFVSAYGDPDTRARVQEAVPGAALLTKPVGPEALEPIISSIGRTSH